MELLVTENKRSAFGPIRWAKTVSPLFLPDGKPDRSAHHVLLVMATFAKRDGTEVRPSMATLADEAYMSLNAVTDAVGRLETAKLICRTGEMNGTTVWRLEMHVQRGPGKTLREIRGERRKSADAERQRRYRQANREKASHANDSVMDHAVDNVTRNGVEWCDVTESTASRHDLEGRDVTHRTPSQPQVSNAVTANILTELPIIELPGSGPTDRADDASVSAEDPLILDAEIVEDEPKPKRSRKSRAKKPVDPEKQLRDEQAHELATRYYEAKNKMAKFLAVRGIIRRALDVFEYDSVFAGVKHLAMVDRDRPFTLETLRSAIERTSGALPPAQGRNGGSVKIDPHSGLAFER